MEAEQDNKQISRRGKGHRDCKLRAQFHDDDKECGLMRSQKVKLYSDLFNIFDGCDARKAIKDGLEK